MHVHINHMYCRESNWGGASYDSSYMVSIRKHLTYDPKATIEADWRLLKSFKIFDKERFDFHMSLKNKPFDEAFLRKICVNTSYRLKPEVFKWLTDNVLDDSKGGKGFCVGSNKYNSNVSDEFSIFFYRRGDALKFIKRWSSYKKPVTYFDYFKMIRKQLDLKTLKLQAVKTFTY